MRSRHTKNREDSLHDSLCGTGVEQTFAYDRGHGDEQPDFATAIAKGIGNARGRILPGELACCKLIERGVRSQQSNAQGTRYECDEWVEPKQQDTTQNDGHA